MLLQQSCACGGWNERGKHVVNSTNLIQAVMIEPLKALPDRTQFVINPKLALLFTARGPMASFSLLFIQFINLKY